MVYKLRDSLHYFSINRFRLVEQMEKGQVLLATDGSNDEGLAKFNPLLVGLFEKDLGYLNVQLLDLSCSTSGTAEILFENISNALRSNEINWFNCVGLSLDNTSVNLGRQNSIKTPVQEGNNSIYINGCTCHIVHKTARICLLIYSISLIKAPKEKSNVKSFVLSVTRNTVKS